MSQERRAHTGRMGKIKRIYGTYHIEKETAGRFQILKETPTGYASIGCYVSPSLAAEEIADQKCGAQWIKERIEDCLKE